MLKTLLCLALLTPATAVFAQSASDTQKLPRSERRVDCSKAKDPKACEERLAKAKAAHQKARQACEGRKGDEERDCMRREMCAQTKDPARRGAISTGRAARQMPKRSRTRRAKIAN